MRIRSKMLLAGLAATLLMSFAVSAASANRFSVSNTKIRVTWEALRFLDDTGTARVTCPISLEGSFHSATIRKIRGALIGYISRAVVNSTRCEGGTATILQTSLPWHVTYDSFEGTLPNITGIRLLLHNLAFDLNILGVQCLYQADATRRAIGIARVAAGGFINHLDADPNIRLLLHQGGDFCPVAAGLEGLADVFLLGNNSRISVRLI